MRITWPRLVGGRLAGRRAMEAPPNQSHVEYAKLDDPVGFTGLPPDREITMYRDTYVRGHFGCGAMPDLSIEVWRTPGMSDAEAAREVWPALVEAGVLRERVAADREEDDRLTIAEVIAREFHDAYEEVATILGWETQERSRVPFDKLPPENRSTMLATVSRLLDLGVIEPGPMVR